MMGLLFLSPVSSASRYVERPVARPMLHNDITANVIEQSYPENIPQAVITNPAVNPGPTVATPVVGPNVRQPVVDSEIRNGVGLPGNRIGPRR